MYTVCAMFISHEAFCYNYAFLMPAKIKFYKTNNNLPLLCVFVTNSYRRGYQLEVPTRTVQNED